MGKKSTRQILATQTVPAAILRAWWAQSAGGIISTKTKMRRNPATKPKIMPRISESERDEIVCKDL